MRLCKDDCCAVDLLLSREPDSPEVMSPCFSTNSATVVKERLSRMESLLHALDHLPEPEPSASLVERTLRRCNLAPGLAAPLPRPDDPESDQVGA